MFKWFLKTYSSTRGWQRLLLRGIWELIRRSLTLLGDPPYWAVIQGKEILLPVSHKLPIYTANCPHYDRLPGRVSAYLRSRDGFLTMIDVGANVGDTILLCFEDQNDKFLAVEVNPFFIKYLERNSSTIPNFELVKAYCSFADSDGILAKITSTNGTGSVIEARNGIALPRKKLDTIIVEHPKFEQYNFLKTDTDGSDFEVIRGARNSITKSKPIILMECDVFDNPNYVSDFSETMNFFLSAGYDTVIAYDNYGYLFDSFALEAHAKFKHALFHQVISELGYFDLIILPSIHRDFVRLELSYFVKSLIGENRRRNAAEALNL